MILLCTGGRTYACAAPDKPLAQAVEEAANVVTALDLAHSRKPVTLLVHGNANGADKACGAWADMRGVPVRPCPVDPAIDGPWPAAGPKRNQRMLDAAKPDGAMALPGGKGTADMCNRLAKAGIKVWRPYG